MLYEAPTRSPPGTGPGSARRRAAGGPRRPPRPGRRRTARRRPSLDAPPTSSTHVAADARRAGRVAARAASGPGPRRCGVDVPVPGLGQVDDRELQALAAVHGQDGDGLGVGLQPSGAVGRGMAAWASAIRSRSHSTSAPTPSWPAVIAACRLWARWRRSVSCALAADLAEQPLGHAFSSVTPPPAARRPRAGRAAGSSRRTRWDRSVSASSSAVGQVGERPAEEAGQRRLADELLARLLQGARAGCSQSWAISRGEHRARARASPPARPAATSASRIASPRSFLRTRTARSAGDHAAGPPRARSRPAGRWRAPG